MNKAVIITILAVFVAGCAGYEDRGRSTYEESFQGDSGQQRPADPNFPTGVPGRGVPGSEPGGIR